METNKDFREELQAMPLNDAVMKLGEFNVSVEDICFLLSDKMDSKRLRAELVIDGTELNTLYRKGKVLGKIDRRRSLSALVGNVKAKDAFKNFTEEQTDDKVSAKIKSNFGLDC
ncbi:MAG: hypothetical protein LBN95_02790 [Prevotellaceae bacterium]|nr:hypothetical protein [Prevotellaceae bacterium]